MEDGFANQPQEAVNAGPELADVAQRLGAVIKKVAVSYTHLFLQPRHAR